MPAGQSRYAATLVESVGCKYIHVGVLLCDAPYPSSVHSRLQGLFIASKTAVNSFSVPTDSSISHRNLRPTVPLYFPVTAATLALSTQQLKAAIKSLRVVWIWLLLPPACHCSVFIRQNEVSVCCVQVQCEFTGILWKE